MQITIRLKGILKIVVFFAFVLCLLSYGAYTAYRHIAYYKALHDIDVKQRSKLDFKYKSEVKNQVEQGYILLAPYVQYKKRYTGALIVMDTKGHVVVKKPVKGVPMDFRQWNTEGHIRYSYFIADSNESNKDSLQQRSCIVILDSTLTEIKKIHMPASANNVQNGEQWLDSHDFIFLSDEHYIIISCRSKQVSNIPAFLSGTDASRVIVPVIQEIENGKLIWKWDASDYAEFYINSEEGNRFYDSTQAQDYMHVNAMIMDPKDSNIIVSFRNLNQVVKISRHTGAIVWRLGGRNSDFSLTASQVFLRSHNVTLTDSGHTIMLFDNGERIIRASSRIVEFRLDEQNKKVLAFKSHKLPQFSAYRGSVQKVGADYFVCGGYAPYLLFTDTATSEEKMKVSYNQELYRAWWVKDVPGVTTSK